MRNWFQVGCALQRGGYVRLTFCLLVRFLLKIRILEIRQSWKEAGLDKFQPLVSKLSICVGQQAGFLSCMLLHGQNTSLESQLWFQICGIHMYKYTPPEVCWRNPTLLLLKRWCSVIIFFFSTVFGIPVVMFEFGFFNVRLGEWWKGITKLLFEAGDW